MQALLGVVRKHRVIELDERYTVKWQRLTATSVIDSSLYVTRASADCDATVHDQHTLRMLPLVVFEYHLKVVIVGINW